MSGRCAEAIGTADVWRWRLYVAGESTHSVTARRNLSTFCDLHLRGRFQIEIIDLVEHPERARDDDILAIPTLLRLHPAPSRTIIGDLSEPAQLLACLHLRRPSSR